MKCTAGFNEPIRPSVMCLCCSMLSGCYWFIWFLASLFLTPYSLFCLKFLDSVWFFCLLWFSACHSLFVFFLHFDMFACVFFPFHLSVPCYSRASIFRVCVFFLFITSFISVRTFYCDAMQCNWSHSGCVLCSFLFFHWIKCVRFSHRTYSHTKPNQSKSVSFSRISFFQDSFSASHHKRNIDPNSELTSESLSIFRLKTVVQNWKCFYSG